MKEKASSRSVDDEASDSHFSPLTFSSRDFHFSLFFFLFLHSLSHFSLSCPNPNSTTYLSLPFHSSAPLLLSVYLSPYSLRCCRFDPVSGNFQFSAFLLFLLFTIKKNNENQLRHKTWY